MNPNNPDPIYSQTDPTDGRKVLDWESRYPVDARKQIRAEACYVSILLFLVPALMVTTSTICNYCENPSFRGGLQNISQYIYGWLAGTLGGTLFNLKWLYHSVARNIWHLDRRLWRILTPHISGGFAFAVIVMISSGMFQIFDREAIKNPELVVSIGFLVGYFTDSAISKMSEIANTLFGSNSKSEG